MRILISWALFIGSVVLFAYDLANYTQIGRFEMYYRQILEVGTIILLPIFAWKQFSEVVKNEVVRVITLLALFSLLTTTWWEENMICDIAHALSYLYILVILILISFRNNSHAKEILR